jgi:hypothetical protein
MKKIYILLILIVVCKGLMADPTLTITGSDTVCVNTSGHVYSVTPTVPYTSYVWGLPTGGSYIALQTDSSSISVTFNATAVSGTITCYGRYVSGGVWVNGPVASLPVTVQNPVGAAGTISGPANVCQNQTGVSYSVPVITNAITYTWTLPSGATIASGYGTNSITVNFGTSSGSITVKGHNSCGDGTSSSLSVTVNPYLPVSVSIVASQNPCCAGANITFTATWANGGSSPVFQWKKNGANAGTNSSTYAYIPVNNDIIQCILTSSVLCPTAGSNPATSNSITMTVNANLAASVVIYANPSGAICQGTTVTFTATPTNGGSTPAYQWKVNGGNVGTNSTTYISNTLNNNDIVTCVMTSNYMCATGNPATSNPITMVVNTNMSPGVTIAASANPSCLGSPVTFTATPTNGGSGPVYQWKVNGGTVGGSGPTYTYNPVNGDNVLCIMTSNYQCLNSGSNPATSNSITMQVVTNVTVSCNITASPSNVVCAGDVVTFTCNTTTGGTSPSFQWKVNGSNVGSNSPTYQYAPSNSDNVLCIMTSSLPCAVAGSNPATSNTITMTVQPINAVSISVAASPSGPICQGTAVTFTATSNNEGTSPVYQWKKNGANVGSNSYIYVDANLNNGDQILCVLTSNVTCPTNNPATSNTISMTVTQYQDVSIIIGASANPVCTGSSVTFNATPTNGGSSPAYQWKKNGVVVAGNNTTQYTYVPANGDQVVCVLTSSYQCPSPGTNPATSNLITMLVQDNIDVYVTISTTTNPSCNFQPVMYTADDHNTGGTVPAYSWRVNNVVAGNNSFQFQYTPSNNDQIKCILTSNSSCASNNPGTSTTIIQSVIDSIPVTISLSASATSICHGTKVTFTAHPDNPGTTPIYYWYVHDSLINNNDTIFETYALQDQDKVKCIVHSSLACAKDNPATSNEIQMNVSQTKPVSILINAKPGSSVCKGESVTFKADSVNGGANPVFQWKLNGSDIGTNIDSISINTLSNLDNIECILTSSELCPTPGTNPATSNVITMNISPVSDGGILPEGDSIICQFHDKVIKLTQYQGEILKWQWRRSSSSSWIDENNFFGDSLVISKDTIGIYYYRAVVKSGVCLQANSNSLQMEVVRSPSHQTLVAKGDEAHKLRNDLFLLCTTCNNDSVSYNYSWGYQLASGDDQVIQTGGRYFCLFPPNTRDTSYLYFLDMALKSSQNCPATRSTYRLSNQLKSTPASLFIYPNPSDAEFHVVVTSDVFGGLELSVKDCFGKELRKESLSKTTQQQEYTLNLGSLNKGIYIVHVRQLNGSSLISKIIVY